MSHTICNQVRFEIDEKDLTAALSTSAMEHLRHCSECQEFQNKQTKLRQIVGSLEPVNAPPDFDFRLRARLANDRTVASFRSMSAVRLWRMRSAAVAAMLLIFAATVYMIRQNQPGQPTPGPDQTTRASNETKAAKEADSPTAPPVVAEISNDGSESSTDVRKKNRRRPLIATSKQATATVDYSNTTAPVLSIDQTFPIDVSQPSFKVSLDDGRGTSRTISVPTVSFGSRRVLTPTMASNQLAPKGDW
jgi:hypothetical protein